MVTWLRRAVRGLEELLEAMKLDGFHQDYVEDDSQYCIGLCQLEFFSLENVPWLSCYILVTTIADVFFLENEGHLSDHNPNGNGDRI